MKMELQDVTSLLLPDNRSHCPACRRNNSRRSNFSTLNSHWPAHKSQLWASRLPRANGNSTTKKRYYMRPVASKNLSKAKSRKRQTL